MKSMNGVFVSACLCAAVFAACPLFATECIWNGASGAWGSQNGWQNGIKPSATGDTVVIKGADVAVTVGDSNIKNFELVSEITIEETGSQLIIDTSSEVNSPAVFNGKGALVKKGVSLLNLTTPGNEYRTLLGNLSGGVIVSNMPWNQAVTLVSTTPDGKDQDARKFIFVIEKNRCKHETSKNNGVSWTTANRNTYKIESYANDVNTMTFQDNEGGFEEKSLQRWNGNRRLIAAIMNLRNMMFMLSYTNSINNIEAVFT